MLIYFISFFKNILSERRVSHSSSCVWNWTLHQIFFNTKWFVLHCFKSGDYFQNECWSGSQCGLAKRQFLVQSRNAHGFPFPLMQSHCHFISHVRNVLSTWPAECCWNAFSTLFLKINVTTSYFVYFIHWIRDWKMHFGASIFLLPSLSSSNTLLIKVEDRNCPLRWWLETIGHRKTNLDTSGGHNVC